MTAKVRPPLPDADARRKIHQELDAVFLVEAAAGTGKTTSMVERMVELIASGKGTTGSMAAITFTRTAAAELRSRFQTTLEREARKKDADKERRGRLDKAVRTIERCFVGTIHSFCARLLRELPVEAGVDVGFKELEENEDSSLIDRAWNDFVARQEREDTRLKRDLARLAVPFAKLGAGFRRFCANADLTWPVEETDLPDAYVAEVAGALTRYLDRMGAIAAEVAPDAKPGWLSWKYRYLARQGAGRDFGSIPELVEFLGEFTLGKDQKSPPYTLGWPTKAMGAVERDEWQAFVATSKVPFLERLTHHRYRYVIEAYRGAMAEYERLKAAAGGLSFNDLLFKAAALLENDEARGYFRDRYTHLLVDEFQDTDPVQAKVMLLLAAPKGEVKDWRAVHPRPGSLFVVGDPKQSIYRFRRADIGTYEEVKRVIKAAGGEVLTLSSNFRSTPGMIDFVNGFFAGRMGPSDYQPEYVPLAPARVGETAGDLTGVEFVTSDPGDGDRGLIAGKEAEKIASFVRQAVDTGASVPRGAAEVKLGKGPGAAWGDFLLLARQGKALDTYGAALQRYRIPHEVSGGSALAAIPELSRLRDILAAIVAPENPVPLVALLRGPLFGVSDAALLAHRRAGGRFSFLHALPSTSGGKDPDPVGEAFRRLRDYRRWLSAMPVTPAVERIAADLGLAPVACLGADGNLQAGGVGKALRLLRGPGGTAQEALDLLDELTAEGAEVDPLPALPPGDTVVRVMTVHKAKGLEAPVVFLVDPSGCGEKWPTELRVVRSGSTPLGFMRVVHKVRTNLRGGKDELIAVPPRWEEEHVRAEEPYADAEEERIRYVAATRAGAKLIIARRGKSPEKSFWLPFNDAHLGELPVPPDGSVTVVSPPGRALSAGEINAQIAAVDARRKGLLEPSFRTTSARCLAGIGAAAGHGGTSSETDGQQKGRAIHALLDAALRHPEADLSKLARSVVAEGEFPDVDVADVVAVARSVAGSDIWRRARASSRCLTEVPFTRCLERDDPDAKGLPTLLRGVIDLAFLEPDGWVIVDWKSNPVTAAEVPEVAARYAEQVRLYRREWERITEEPVTEIGLYFTAPKRYERLSWQ